MNRVKYIALDVHLECIVIVVRNATGRVLLKDVITTLGLLFCTTTAETISQATNDARISPGVQSFIEVGP